MNYLRDKQLSRSRRKKSSRALPFLIIILALAAYFYRPIFDSIQSFAVELGRPIWVKSNDLGTPQDLRLEELSARLSNYNALLAENLQLKEILGRRQENNFILAAILAKPNRSPYDTTIIDLGGAEGAVSGQNVFAYGNVLIGRIDEAEAKVSRVKLFSTPGEKINALIVGGDISENISVEVLGRGGQNFEMTLPQNLQIEKGTEVVLPGMTPYTLGIVEEIISDPRDPFQKVLLRSPVNIQQLKFVEVEAQ